MARWLVIPILGGMLLAGTAQAQPDPKPGAAMPRTTSQSPAPRRRMMRPPMQDSMAPAPGFEGPSPSYGGRNVRPSPSDPYRGVTLPRQNGDAAYQGGGVVLEQDETGANRRIR